MTTKLTKPQIQAVADKLLDENAELSAAIAKSVTVLRQSIELLSGYRNTCRCVGQCERCESTRKAINEIKELLCLT